MGMALLRLENIKKYFRVRGSLFKSLKAVDGVSLEIGSSETLGLVGESGCGKSTLGRVAIRLLEPTAGRIIYEGVDITRLSNRKLKEFRRRAQIVFQDPNTSLNPRMTVYEILVEPLYEYGMVPSDPESFLVERLNSVGLGKEHLFRYPHELSGGQKQRIAILRALLLNPSLIVLDEPTSSLDVSVQAQILNMLKDLQAEHKISYLFISHDIAVVNYMSDRIAVMYLGKIVEEGKVEAVLESPAHPYTKFLLNAVPIPDPKLRNRKREMLQGEPPSPINVPPGCRFHPRCPYAMDICRREEPPFFEIEPNHRVACWLYSK